MPIAILSLNRPDYLREVLHSLRSQISSLDEVVLFQDGAVNPWSGSLKAASETIQRCIDIFKRLIPWGTVLASADNIGIALNYERAEQYMFEMLGKPYALFLEDDLVLSPRYLTTIQSLIDIAMSDNRIAYVSAYGNMWASLHEQRNRRRELQHMHENWGFAMTRQAWFDERPFRKQYLELLHGQDYSERDTPRILHFYERRGWKTILSSQDCARWIASVELGKVRITTFVCHARYIGENGQNFNPEAYYSLGFDQTLMSDTLVAKPVPPTASQIASWLETERKRFRGEEVRPFYTGHVT
ncbi:MAG TPA: hypothetical protein VH678_30610 [Xanthobacteraceae bacterium]|jgi:hypothetical protein